MGYTEPEVDRADQGSEVGERPRPSGRENAIGRSRHHVGNAVEVFAGRGRIIVEPVSRVRGRYDLKALVSKMPEEYRPEELDWGPPAGKEVCTEGW